MAQTLSPLEIIVVDNGSKDGSVEWVQNTFPNVHLIANDRNLGFAAANNQALHAARGEYIATLNNDAWATPTWLAELVRAAQSDPSVGMCASKMLFADRPYMINSTGINLDWAGIAWDRQGGELDDKQENEPVEVFGPCAGAALYRREMLEELGGFDEDFFAYLEDVDLAWRARLAGWRCLYVPNAVVYHHHSATAKEGSYFKNYLLGRNKIWLLAKNYPMPYLLKYLPIIVLYDWGTLPYSLVVRGDWSAINGRLAALRDIRKLWRKRRATQASTRDFSWVNLMQPVESPWRVLRRYRHLYK
jgi:GT2 family glycosyltransferase